MSAESPKPTHIQVEFFTVNIPTETSNLFEWLKRKAVDAFSIGTRLKYCVRVALFDNDMSELILNLIQMQDLNDIHMNHIVYKVLGVKGQSLRKALVDARTEAQKVLSDLIKKLISESNMDTICVEDVNHEYSKVSDEQTLKSLKKLLCENDFNFCVFVCRSERLDSDEQEVLFDLM